MLTFNFFPQQFILSLGPQDLCSQSLRREQCAIAVAPGVIGNLKKGFSHEQTDTCSVRSHPFATHEECCLNAFIVQKGENTHIAACGHGGEFAQIKGQSADALVIVERDTAYDAFPLT